MKNHFLALLHSPPPPPPRAFFLSLFLKVIWKTELRPHDEESLRREVRILSSLRHPGVLKLSAHVETEAHHFLVTELLPGGDLFERIVARIAYPEDEGRAVVRQLFRVLLYLHEDARVVHRDLKPENVLLLSQTDNITIRVADFGFARSLDDLASADATSVRFGTIDYMAPEILPPARPRYGTAGDIWACGIIAYVLLAGHPPFFDPEEEDGVDENDSIANRIRGDQYSFDTPAWEHVSEEAMDLIRRALTADPEARPTARQLLRQ